MASDEGAADRDRGSRRRGARPAPSGGAGRAGDPVVRLLLALTGFFAVVAAVVVVVSEDGRLLRLGIVAGLWATLLAVAALARRSASGGAEDVAALEESLRRTYELELAAEVDARREHELTVERAVRREVAAEASEEIAGLRAELERLRTHLEQAETHAARPALQVVAGGAPPAPMPPAPPRPVTPIGPRRGREAPGPPSGPDPRREGPQTDPDPRREGPQTGPDLRRDVAGPDLRREPEPASWASVPPPPSRPEGDGRTVAELLAAHSADGRRRGR